MARRKPQSQKLKRNQATKEPYDRVLIVCGAEQTEPNYFNYLINSYKLKTVTIEKYGYEPVTLIKETKRLVDKERKNGNSFNRVFCIFDKDEQPKYENALNELKKLSQKNKVLENADIVSVPCFEYWYLLHFDPTTKPFQKSPKTNSLSKQVIDELKKHIPNYEKYNQNMFQQLAEKLPFAIKNAKNSLVKAKENQTDNPTTKVHLLVEYLQGLNLPIAIKHIETLLSQAKENKMDNVKIRVLEQYLNQLREKQKLKK
ncbi:MAG: RloB domain-containing protein [Neisseriaceae bacterium]|nr:RloB domain-containing protein [Neisseriaceae bacterium]